MIKVSISLECGVCKRCTEVKVDIATFKQIMSREELTIDGMIVNCMDLNSEYNAICAESRTCVNRMGGYCFE